MIVHFLPELIGTMCSPIDIDIPEEFDNDDYPLESYLKPDKIISVRDDPLSVLYDEVNVPEVTVFCPDREDTFLFFCGPDELKERIGLNP